MWQFITSNLPRVRPAISVVIGGEPLVSFPQIHRNWSPWQTSVYIIGVASLGVLNVIFGYVLGFLFHWMKEQVILVVGECWNIHQKFKMGLTWSHRDQNYDCLRKLFCWTPWRAKILYFMAQYLPVYSSHIKLFMYFYVSILGNLSATY